MSDKIMPGVDLAHPLHDPRLSLMDSQAMSSAHIPPPHAPEFDGALYQDASNSLHDPALPRALFVGPENGVSTIDSALVSTAFAPNPSPTPHCALDPKIQVTSLGSRGPSNGPLYHGSLFSKPSLVPPRQSPRPSSSGDSPEITQLTPDVERRPSSEDLSNQPANTVDNSTEASTYSNASDSNPKLSHVPQTESLVVVQSLQTEAASSSREPLPEVLTNPLPTPQDYPTIAETGPNASQVRETPGVNPSNELSVAGVPTISAALNTETECPPTAAPVNSVADPSDSLKPPENDALPELNPALEDNGNFLSVGGSEPEPALNGDQEIVRSREMSLSMDSNPDTSAEPLPREHGDPSQVVLTDHRPTAHSAVPVNALGDTELPASGEVARSPRTDTALQFPLPAKPPVEQAAPLFNSSPPLSAVQEFRRSPPRQTVLSRLASLRQRVEKDPMDGEAWVELIADAEKKGDLEKTREVYHSFLQNFPDAASQWIAYADLELGHGHFPEVEQVFSRCLRSSVSVDLWAFYLNYIRRVNPVEGDKAAASRGIIISAYDFSLNHIGIDRESGQIWMDYINIVKSGETSGTWQEQQQMDSVRKLYQRAVCIPLDNIEQLWKEYDQFEHQMSKTTAKKFLADKSAQYLLARSALKEMKTLMDPLLKPKVPAKPNWKRVDDHKQIDQWKAYLRWEESNPLELQDKTMLNSRIQYAHRQAIMHMRFHPEIWYLTASHLAKTDKLGESLAVIQAGLIANPTSIVLTYALVEAQEDLKNLPVCYAAFKSLIEHFHAEIDEINKTIEKEIAHGIPILESRTANAMESEIGNELTDEEKQRVKEEEQLRTNVTALYKPKVDELREAAASVWITEMQFARRTEGIKPARAVFTRARKSPHLTRHVFEASAMMEYHWNKEASVATKVFDLGLKSFSEDVHYVLQYLNFLITLNDDSNARALFEKTVSKIPPEAARPLWQRWAAYEFIYGDTAASQKLDARMAEHFPEWGVVNRLCERHNYEGLQDVLGRELGTTVEPIPLRRSPSPVPAHLEGFGFKRNPASNSVHLGPIPSGPAAHRARHRERSFSPDFRGKRSRAPRNSPSPDRRNGGVLDHPPLASKKGRDVHDTAKRNRYHSPPRGRDTPPPVAPARENPYAWFPEKIRYFLGILPTAASFDGPRLDASTVLQVLTDANIPAMPTTNSSSSSQNNHVPLGWGPNRGGGSVVGGNPHQPTGRGSSSARRGRRK